MTGIFSKENRDACSLKPLWLETAGGWSRPENTISLLFPIPDSTNGQ